MAAEDDGAGAEAGTRMSGHRGGGKRSERGKPCVDNRTVKGESEMKVNAELHIETPIVPNFLRIAGRGDNNMISIADLSDEELKKVGAAWTAALCEKANERRAQK